MGLFSSGIFVHSNAVFFRPIRKDLSLSSAEASILFSLSRVAEGFIAPIVGPVIDRVGGRPMIILGAIIASAGLIALHWVDGYLSFLLVFVGVVSLGRSVAFGQALMTPVNSWFLGRRALAVSIQSSGFATGGLVVVPLITLGIHTIGWRDVMLYTGIFVVAMAIPLATAVQRSPESMGVEPEGMYLRRQQRTTSYGNPEVGTVAPDYTVKEALQTSTFWLLVAGSTLKLAVLGAIMVHAVEIMVWKGIDEQSAGFLFAFLFFLSIPLRVAMGVLGVRFPVQLMICGGLAAGALGTTLLLLLEGKLAVFLFIALVAIDHSVTPLSWVSVGNYFGRRSFSSLFGVIIPCINVGMLISPIYLGWVRDTTDSYQLALISFLPVYAISAFLFLIMRSPPLPARLRPAVEG